MARNSPKRKNRKDSVGGVSPNEQFPGTLYKSSSTASKSDLTPHLNVKQINFSHFTEHDKRVVIQKFLSSQEVLFLIYGLMFPS